MALSPRHGVLPDVVMRINIPKVQRSANRQEYQIIFRDEAMLGQATASLESATDASSDGTPPSESPSNDRRKCGESGWLCPPQDDGSYNTVEAQVSRHRQETLDILEGLRPYAKYFDWQGAIHEPYFNLRAIMDASTSKPKPRPTRLGLVYHEQPEGGSPAFSWEHLHRVIVEQLSEDDRAHFPAWQEGTVATLLFMGPECEGGVQRVMNSFALHEHTVFQFRMLMLDVAVRGRRDVLWLSHPGEMLPLGLRNGEAIEMRWGEGMI